MCWIEVLLEQDSVLLAWLIGRRSTARLLAASATIRGAAGGLLPFEKSVTLLHEVSRERPLGLTQCRVSSDWIFVNLHLTADRPGTQHATYPLRTSCPHCGIDVSYYLWGATRYLHVGYYNSRVLSEGHADTDFQRSESSWEPQLEVEADRLDEVGHPHEHQALLSSPVNPRDMSIAAIWPGGSMRENQMTENENDAFIENLVINTRLNILDIPAMLRDRPPPAWRSPSSDRTTVGSDMIQENNVGSPTSTPTIVSESPTHSTDSNPEALGNTASGIHSSRRHWGHQAPISFPNLHSLATDRLNHIAEMEVAEGRDGLTFRQGNRDHIGPLPDFSSDGPVYGPQWVPGWLISQRTLEEDRITDRMWTEVIEQIHLS